MRVFKKANDDEMRFLFGSFDWEDTEELHDYKPHDLTIAPVTQLYHDLCTAYTEFAGFCPGWEAILKDEENEYVRMLTFQTPEEKIAMKHPDESRVQGEEGFVIDTAGYEKFKCPECGKLHMQWHRVCKIQSGATSAESPGARQGI